MSKVNIADGHDVISSATIVVHTRHSQRLKRRATSKLYPEAPRLYTEYGISTNDSEDTVDNTVCSDRMSPALGDTDVSTWGQRKSRKGVSTPIQGTVTKMS